MRKLSGTSESVNPLAHPNYSKNNNYSHFQPEMAGSAKLNLAVAHVSENLALADDRFHINDGSWWVGTPLTRDKVYRAIKRIGSRPNPGSITIAIKGGAA